MNRCLPFIAVTAVRISGFATVLTMLCLMAACSGSGGEWRRIPLWTSDERGELHAVASAVALDVHKYSDPGQAPDHLDHRSYRHLLGTAEAWSSPDGITIVAIPFEDYRAAHAYQANVHVIVVRDAAGRAMVTRIFVGDMWMAHSLWRHTGTGRTRLVWIQTGAIFQGGAGRRVALGEVAMETGHITDLGHVAIEEHVLEHLQGIDVSLGGDSIHLMITFAFTPWPRPAGWDDLPRLELSGAANDWMVDVILMDQNERRRLIGKSGGWAHWGETSPIGAGTGQFHEASGPAGE